MVLLLPFVLFKQDVIEFKNTLIDFGCHGNTLLGDRIQARVDDIVDLRATTNRPASLSIRLLLQPTSYT